MYRLMVYIKSKNINENFTELLKFSNFIIVVELLMLFFLSLNLFFKALTFGYNKMYL